MCFRIVMICGALAASAAASAAEQPIAKPASAPAWSTFATEPILDATLPLEELQAYAAPRIPKLLPPRSLAEWESQANAIRTDVLDKVVFRGEASRWRVATTRVEWLETIGGASDYTIRKFRYEALPGMWFPGLLYEPANLRDPAPVFINVNGHDELGNATPQTQLRCINLAKRGVLAYLLEFLDMGQLQHHGNRHNALVQLDLCGTSGVAPFVLALTRGLDVALAHPQADKTRVGVAGLSGGGWQTIMLAALDRRITLANPVAGYSSMASRVEHPRDLGDAEQIPADLCTVADYTHLTAIVAPHPLLLTYNAKDECCFLPDNSLPQLEQSARPIYRLYGAANRLNTHVNHEPGTHNFESDNREALYRLVGDFFFAGNQDFNRREMRIAESELKTREELNVALPASNATLHSLAVEINRTLPQQAELPRDPADLAAWRSAALQRLREIICLEHYVAHFKPVGSTNFDGIRVTRSTVSFSDEWTLPVVELASAESRATAIVFGDQGRQTLVPTIERWHADSQRVFAVDLSGFGETNTTIQPIEWQLIAAVGGRLLGIQSAQLAALARLVHARQDDSAVTLVALGPRSSIIALVAAAIEPDAIAAVELHASWPSLKEFIVRNLELKVAPELSCFGLLGEFDVPQLAALVHPRQITCKDD